MRIKVGDKIRHYLFSGKVLIGNIKGIQICRQGEKTGRPVQSCDVEMHHGVIDLDNGHWCYFDQVIQVIQNGKDNQNDPQILG